VSARFVIPAPGASMPVRFPRIGRANLPNGLNTWTIAHPTIPAFTAMIVLPRGTAHDPPSLPGLASLTVDLLDEGAGSRDAIQLSDALARLGAELDVEVGPDATLMSIRSLSRHLDAALGLLADMLIRPRLAAPDFERVRELRLNRLKQLSRSGSTIADRAFTTAVFGTHPYAHGALGTTAALSAMTVEDARAFSSRLCTPAGATLILAGDVDQTVAQAAANRAFGEWTGGDADELPLAPLSPADATRVLFVERHGAAQAEVRIGHVGPPRRVEEYHALITLNAVLGGQFTSRINQRLRQEKGVTYGARTSFEFRRVAGVFSCESSVQATAIADAVADVLAEFADVRAPGAVGAGELERAKASLTRGYARHFETAGQIVRGAAQLVLYGLADDTFDRFVERVDAITLTDLQRAAHAFIRPDDAVIVVVGDPEVSRPALERLGRVVEHIAPVF
jgi:zinc protease